MRIHVWMGNVPLCDRFPRLYSISSYKNGTVNEFCSEKERLFRGEWGWRRRLFVWEHTLLDSLAESMPIVVLSGRRMSGGGVWMSMGLR
jgi:hypothetical protein